MAGKPGKKSVRWDQDIEILQRLAVVSTMLLQGARPFQIAESMGTSLRTAFRDISRVDELNRRAALADIETNRARSIALLREVQTRAWELYRTNDASVRERLAALKEARECEEQIATLQGTKKPIGIDVTTKGDKLTGVSAKELSDDELAGIAAGRSR